MGVVIRARVLVGVAPRKEVRDRWRQSETGEGEGSENNGSPETSMQLRSKRQKEAKGEELHRAPLSILSIISISSWLTSSSKERELKSEVEEASWMAGIW